jgi:hypothetical protein
MTDEPGSALQMQRIPADVDPVHDDGGRSGPDGVRLPTSPTGRVPQWVLDEAAGFPVTPVPWREWAPSEQVGARRRRTLVGRILVVLCLTLGLSLGGAVLAGPGPWPWAPVPEGAESVGAVPGVGTEPEAHPDRPTPGWEAADSPLGRPLPPPPEGGPHAFAAFQTDGVTPVAYDPCRPVHYVIRPDGAPEGGEELVHAAVARLAEVTGLQFVHDGSTDEATTRDREIFQPDRYGDRWVPVLVVWETEEQNPALAGDFVGEGGSVAVSLGDGPRVFLTGIISLDAAQLPEILAGRDGAATARSILLHELAHLVGLAHVDDDQQLMYPETRRAILDFGSGDLTGLAALGSGSCVPEL